MPAAKSRKRLPSMSSTVSAVTPDGHDRVGPRQARRGPGLVVGHVGAGLGPGTSVMRSGTGRSPARRFWTDDTGHLWSVRQEPRRTRRESARIFASENMQGRPIFRQARMVPRPAPVRQPCTDGSGVGLVDDGVALLPQELGDVVHRQAGLAGRARALPAAERLDARPRSGRRAGPPVDVQDARLGRVEEALDLAGVLAVDAGRQAVDGVIREPDRLVERVDRGDRRERREQLVAEQAMVARQVARRPSARRRSRGPSRGRSGARRR